MLYSCTFDLYMAMLPCFDYVKIRKCIKMNVRPWRDTKFLWFSIDWWVDQNSTKFVFDKNDLNANWKNNFPSNPTCDIPLESSWIFFPMVGSHPNSKNWYHTKPTKFGFKGLKMGGIWRILNEKWKSF